MLFLLCKISKEIADWYRNKLGIDFATIYGASEVGFISYGKYKDGVKEGYVGDHFGMIHMKLRKVEGFPFVTEKGKEKIIIGEIMVSPHTTLTGYYKDEEKTKMAFDSNGYYHTKDIGEYHTETGDLYLVDRMANIITLPCSDNVPATFVENCLMGSKYIKQAVVYGDIKSDYLTYILNINKEMFDKDTDFGDQNENFIIHNPKVEEIIKNDLEKIYKENDFFEHYLGKYFIFVSKMWTSDEDLVTTSGKIKRGEVTKKYMNIILEQRKDEKLEIEPEFYFR